MTNMTRLLYYSNTLPQTQGGATTEEFGTKKETRKSQKCCRSRGYVAGLEDLLESQTEGRCRATGGGADDGGCWGRGRRRIRAEQMPKKRTKEWSLAKGSSEVQEH